jgi:CRISPR-associated protein Csm1
MPTPKAERAAEFALAALLRGFGEFAHRVTPSDTSAQALKRFAEKHLSRFLSSPAANSALRLALQSCEPRDPDARLLDSAWRFASGVEPTRDFRAHRMRSPLATIFDFRDPNGAVLPLNRLELDATIFSTTKTDRADSLQKLFEQFARAMSELQSADILALVQSAAAVLEAFAWSVPADGYEDVSVFELARSAGAIAAALAAELPAETTQTDYAKAALLLAVCDLGGIQRFLYTVVASKAARMLRGRSLALQLIADGIAHRILSQLGLPASNLLYSGGGKLWLLASASQRGVLLALAEEIDLELHKAFATRLSFGVGCATTKLAALSARASELWQNATRDLARRRRRRFLRSLKTNYDLIFEPFGDSDQACRVCGTLSEDLKPLSRDDDDHERPACRQCRDFVELGRYVTRAQVIIRQPGGSLSTHKPSFSYSPPACDDRYLLYDHAAQAASAPAGSTVMWVNSFSCEWSGPVAHSVWLAGLNRAVGADGEPLDFDELAANSEGIKRLGILRMDVDSLGNIFRNGLGKRASLPGIAALSRHLTYFFGGYLANMLDRPEYQTKLQIIYSGGDDIFIVGAWSEMPLIARKIRDEFTRFTAGNPHWGISAGIEIAQPAFPIAAGAELAGKAEERAKRYSRANGSHRGEDKDALCFLSEVFGWKENEEFDVLCKLKDTLRELFPRDGGQGLPRATLLTLHAIADQAREAADCIVDSTSAPSELAHVAHAVKRGKWAWRAAYALARASAHGDAREKLNDLYRHLERFDWRNSTSSRPVLWLLKPAAEWVDLLNREKRP